MIEIMKRKIQFAVIMTDEKKTVLVIDNDGIFKSMNAWQNRFRKVGYTVLYSSETDSIDMTISHFFIN